MVSGPLSDKNLQNGGARFTNVEQQYARDLLMQNERIRRLIEPLQGRESFNAIHRSGGHDVGRLRHEAAQHHGEHAVFPGDQMIGIVPAGAFRLTDSPY
ncbi:MAG: hypothetical protein GEU95_18635 [Rhizobiales bacterium]|nr:hypothetical protein [Hyphomicrobiales bacterium]